MRKPGVVPLKPADVHGATLDGRAGRPEPLGRGRGHPRRRGRRLHDPRRRHRRAGRPQRRRQDLAAEGARRHGPAQVRRRAPPGRLRLPAPGPTPRRRARRRHLRQPGARRPGPRRAGRPPGEAAGAHGGAARATRPTSPGGARPTTPSSTPAATRPSPRPGACSPASGSAGTGPSHPVGVLSGGERRRVELARILFAGTELLMLDEPTNHLDNDARDWLLGFLRDYRGALLVISHDLELLDESITRVLHLDRARRGRRRRDHRVQGHLLAVRRRRGPPTRCGWPRSPPASRPRSTASRRSSTASGPRQSKAAFANALETRIARIEASGVARPCRPALAAPPHARAAAVGDAPRSTVSGLAKSYGGRPRVRPTSPSTSGGASAS